MSRQRHSLLHTSAAIISCSLLLWACGAKTDLLSGSSAQSGGSGGTSQQGGSGGTSQQGGSGGEQTGGSTSAGEGGGGAAGEAGTGGVAGGPIVRTILQRDPFENVDDPHNLLLDGGFEFSGSLSIPWNSAGYSSLRFGHGVTCRSGIRCAIFDKNEGIFAIVVSPKSSIMNVTLHAKHDPPSCDGLSLYVLDVYNPTGASAFVAKTSTELDSDGWCEWKGWAPAIPNAFPVLYIDTVHSRVVIDDVVVSLPEDEEQANAGLRALQQAPKKISAETMKTIEKVAALARADLMHQRKRPMTIRSVVPRDVRIAPWIR